MSGLPAVKGVSCPFSVLLVALGTAFDSTCSDKAFSESARIVAFEHAATVI